MARRVAGSRTGTLKGHASTTLDDALKYKLTPPQARKARRRRNKSTYPSQKAAQAAARLGGKARKAGAKEHQARKPTARKTTKKRTTKKPKIDKRRPTTGSQHSADRLKMQNRQKAKEKRRGVTADRVNRAVKGQNSTTKEALTDKSGSTSKKQANAQKRRRAAAKKAQNQRRKTVKRKAKKVTAKKVAKASNSRRPQPTRSTTSRSTSRPTTTTSTTTRWNLRPSTYKPVYKPPKPKGAHGNKKGRGHQGSFNTR